MIKNYLYLSFICLLFSCQQQTKTKQVDAVQTETAEIPTKEVKKKTSKKILFFGDSLTAGYQLNEDQSFPSILQHKITDADLDYEVINAGLSGETTAGGLNRLDWVLNQPIDIFVLELGANDALRGFDLSVTKDNLDKIIKKVKEKDSEIEIILAGMLAPPNMGKEYGTQFADIFKTLSNQHNLGLIPFLLRDVAGIAKLNLQDGIHPNAEGQKIVAQNVWEVLKEYL